MGKTKRYIEEKRSYPRLRRLYLISYINKEGDRQITPVSMGRTLDISPIGVRVEVFQQIGLESKMEMEIGVEESNPDRKEAEPSLSDVPLDFREAHAHDHDEHHYSYEDLYGQPEHSIVEK